MLNIFGLFPVVAAIALRLSYIVILLSTALAFLAVFTGYTFSRYMRTNGGHYSYVGNILGKGPGTYTAYIYLFYGFFTFPSIILFITSFIPYAFPYTLLNNMGIQMVIAIGFAILIISIHRSGLKYTMKYIAVSSVLEIIAISAFVLFLGTTGHFTSPDVSVQASPIINGLPFGILSFAGISSSIFLSENTKQWHRNTNRSVILAFVVLSLLMIAPALVISLFLSGSQILQYSGDALAIFPTSGPTVFLRTAIVVLSVNSGVNLSIGYLNAFRSALTRMISDNVISDPKKTISRHISSIIFGVGISIVLISIFLLGSYEAFVVVTGVVTLMFLAVHSMSNSALVKFFGNRGNKARMIIPLVSVISFVFIIVMQANAGGAIKWSGLFTILVLIISLLALAFRR